MPKDQNRSFDDAHPTNDLLRMTSIAPDGVLDLRKTKCPLNFVKAKLALEKKAIGEQVDIWVLTDAESALNIPQSLRQEGHVVDFLEAVDNIQPLRVTRG